MKTINTGEHQMNQHERQPRIFSNDLANSHKTDWNPVLSVLFEKRKKLYDFENDLKVQCDLGLDKAIVTEKGRKYALEMKTRDANKYFGRNTWLLEVVHQIYDSPAKKTHLRTKEGWLYASTADIIIIGTVTTDKKEVTEFIAFTIMPFKDVGFKEKITALKSAWAKEGTVFSNGNFQETLNKMASFDFIKNNAQSFLGLWRKQNGFWTKIDY